METKTEKTTIVVPLGTYSGATLTVSDPCYLADYYDLAYGNCSVAAVNEGPLADGAWNGYSIVFDDGDGWGERVWYAGIRLAEPTDADKKTEAVQGVDAGFVGFFLNRPDLTYDEICNHYLRRQKDTFIAKDGSAVFATSSGIGDGAYRVEVGWLDGKIISVDIDYYGEDEES